MNWEVVIKGVRFANPVLAASGTFGFGYEFRRIASGLGGVVTKAVTVEPRAGNPPPRVAEVRSGVVNSVGLENPGLAVFQEKILPRLNGLKCRVVVNIAGKEETEFCYLAEALSAGRIDALELNLSCPNVKEGGVLFGQSPAMVERITKAVRRRTEKLLIVKLTANFVDPQETARAAEAGGADAVSLINTLFALVLDENGRPLLGGRTGGLSGPAIKPFALFCVERVARAIRVPVIGGGGIVNGRDAFEFLSAGARMITVGTANLVAPDGALRVWRELAALGRKKGWQDRAGTIGNSGRQK